MLLVGCVAAGAVFYHGLRLYMGLELVPQAVAS